MTISIVQSHAQTGTIGSTSWTYSYASTPSVGNALVVLYTGECNPSYPTGITDNQSGNTYSALLNTTFTGSGATVSAWWCPSLASASGTFTLTITTVGTANGNPQYAFLEVSGLNGSIDQSAIQNQASSVSTNVITNGGANTNANDLVLSMNATQYGGVVSQAGAGPSSGYTQLSSFNPGSGGVSYMSGYKIVSAIETDVATFTWGTATPAIGAIVSLQGTGSSTPFWGQICL